VLHLDDLVNKALKREERSSARKGLGNTPSIHLHLDSALGDLLNAPRTTSTSGSNKRSRDNSPSEEEDLSDVEATSITDILSNLHKKMPDLNYPQYEAALKKEGVAYANAVAEFDKKFFVEDIGMARGAVGEFMRAAKRGVKGMGKKRARHGEKENI
jgi:hypothetical protein